MNEPGSVPERDSAFGKFVAVGVVRISGALLLIFGLAIALQHFSWITGDRARILGFIFAIVGFAQMAVVPLFMLRAFRSPPPP